MLLIQPSSKKRKNYIRYILLASLLFFLLFLAKKYNPYFLHSKTNNTLIFCDAEKVTDDKFWTANHAFGNGNTQSHLQAHSGKYACRLDQKNKYGMSFVLEQPKVGDRYKVSVWRYKATAGQSFLAINGTENLKYYKQENRFTIKDENAWEQLQLYVNVPKYEGKGNLKFYVYLADAENVFFDDLKIEKIALDSTKQTVDLIKPLHLELKEKAYQKIVDKRQNALYEGFLVSEDTDWAKGHIKNEPENLSVELRLKGDFLDHLRGEKWSFRIKAKGDAAWNRLKTFSVQNPETREFLNEWFYHKWLAREGVLSPRYDFMSLTLNEKDLGIYAFEEHFDKQLPEFKQRREGVIVRYAEDGVWLGRKREYDAFGEIMYHPHLTDAFESSPAEPFKSGKTQKSKTLSKQFESAQSLLHQYKYNLKPPKAIFDLKMMAKYYAITDILQAYHALFWINQRFYYNPVTTKLEPIGYDGFSHAPNWVKRPFFAYGTYQSEANMKPFFKNLFLDKDFLEQYISELYRLSHPNYMQQLFSDLENDIFERELLIQEEFNEYSFDYKRFEENAKKIHHIILPFNNVSIQAFKAKKTKNEQQILQVVNYHKLPLRVIGFGQNEKMMLDTLSEKIWLEVHKKNQVPKYYEMKTSKKTDFIFYELSGIDSVFYSQISEWQRPQNTLAHQSLWEDKTWKKNKAFSVDEKTKSIIFYEGKHEIEKNIVIPENYTIKIGGNTQLNFTKKAAFISKSPVLIFGTAEKPIKISSSDGTANGFTVLQTNEKSILHHVVFDNFNTLKHKNWLLTGAVTFYEADVDIQHCVFTKNNCEDGLNLVRSNFEISFCTISHTFSDGFDADFCKGTIADSYFLATGNDGMDFSGSQITIKNCEVKQAGDKGISVGEEAKVTIVTATIDGAVIGVASKDLSVLAIKNIDLKNCKQGFAAYQKKPEYGGSNIVVKNYSAEQVKHLYQVEANSSLILKGKKVEN
ncbi:MAG: right-handed parallel beta-helix repeat-containing protein [Chitinophagales bacterium]